MNVLVTGGAGFIGSHIVDSLVEQGHSVTIVDNLSTGKKEYIHPKASFYNIDVVSPELKEVFAKSMPEVVFHLAAQVDVDKSIKEPIYDQNINIAGCINVLDCCKDYGTRKIVYASSAAIYGKPKELPIGEDHTASPISFYGISKYTPEMYMSVYSNLYGLDYTILRYGNVYGPRQAFKGEGGVISIFINRILENEPLFVYGDGNQTRDFIFVKDIVQANMAALHSGSKGTYNVSNNYVVSLNELIHMLKDITGSDISLFYKEDRAGDIRESWLNNEKVVQELNWNPQYKLYEGLKETVDYYSQNMVGSV